MRISSLELLTIIGILFQGLFMFIDEWYFHRKRGLPSWEKWGHPIDSLFYSIPLSIASFSPISQSALTYYFISSIFSSILITKDEWVHAESCESGEQFVHSLLFILHPSILFGIGMLWWKQEGDWIRLSMPFLVLALCAYQLIYWLKKSPSSPTVNNDFYDELGEKWYSDDTHAVALLRAESKKKLEYVQKVLKENNITAGKKILDIGCGGGFISNPLAKEGYSVKGVDLSSNSIETAKKWAPADTEITYEVQNAYSLFEKNSTYDVVLMLDFLEHIEDISSALSEVFRVLKPDGLFILHTFNKTPLAWLLAIHGISFVTKDCPKHVHVYSLFRKPEQLKVIGSQLGFQWREFIGIRPQIFQKSFFWSLLYRRIHPQFSFSFTRFLGVGYLGYFQKTQRSIVF